VPFFEEVSLLIWQFRLAKRIENKVPVGDFLLLKTVRDKKADKEIVYPCDISSTGDEKFLAKRIIYFCGGTIISPLR
jgi:hypothetical protein